MVDYCVVCATAELFQVHAIQGVGNTDKCSFLTGSGKQVSLWIQLHASNHVLMRLDHSLLLLFQFGSFDMTRFFLQTDQHLIFAKQVECYKALGIVACVQFLVELEVGEGVDKHIILRDYDQS